jgi:hypothetical protein
MDTRSQFLAEFLGALGAKEIRHLKASPDFVSGTVVYDLADPEEQQDFCWSLDQSASPSPAATRLMAFIRREGLLHSDKLLVSRHDLLARFSAAQSSPASTEKLSLAFDEILKIRVPMLDDGVESDQYFIHE